MSKRSKEYKKAVIDEIISVFTEEEIEKFKYQDEEGIITFRERLEEEFRKLIPKYGLSYSKFSADCIVKNHKEELDRGKVLSTIRDLKEELFRRR